MPLDFTPTGVHHAVDVNWCPHLPGAGGLVILPLPGAPPYVCPTPCSGRVCRFASTCPPPLPLPRVLCLELKMPETLATLVEAARAVSQPAGTAADLSAPAGWGSLRYYRN